LYAIVTHFSSGSLDDLLLIAIIFSSFHMLLKLGESTQPDTEFKHSFRKATFCQLVIIMPNSFLFTLPAHKSDHFFDGSMVLIESRPNKLCLACLLYATLQKETLGSCFMCTFWLCSTGQIPTYSWVECQLKSALGSDVAGHSLCSGGTTALTLASTLNDQIQACRQWSSQAYHTYICKHPIMLQSLLHGWSAFDP